MDWGDGLSGAATGASTGFGMGGPVGAVAGGLIGGALGLFSQKQQMEEYHNPYSLQISAGIDKMMNSDTGAQMAAQQTAGIRKQQQESFNQIQSAPGVAGNASLSAALYNKVASQADDSAVNSQLSGAELDQKAHTQGLGMKMGQAASDRTDFEYNQGVRQQNNKPGFFENALMGMVSQGAGTGLGKLLGGGDPSGDSPGTTPGSSKLNLAGIPQPRMPGAPQRPSVAPPGRVQSPFGLFWDNQPPVNGLGAASMGGY